VQGRERERESKYNPEVTHRPSVANSTFILIFQYETTTIHETEEEGEKREKEKQSLYKV
jgi:hypothetical protein